MVNAVDLCPKCGGPIKNQVCPSCGWNPALPVAGKTEAQLAADAEVARIRAIMGGGAVTTEQAPAGGAAPGAVAPDNLNTSVTNMFGN